MNYFEHNDAKGRDARIRVEINRAERARMRQPFDGTLFMSRVDVIGKRVMGWTLHIMATAKYVEIPAYAALLKKAS